MINKQHYAKGQYSIWCSGGESGTQENDIIHLHPFLRSLSVNLVCFVDLFARLCFCFCCGNKALKAPLTQCHTMSQIHTPITSTPRAFSRPWESPLLTVPSLEVAHVVCGGGDGDDAGTGVMLPGLLQGVQEEAGQQEVAQVIDAKMLLEALFCCTFRHQHNSCC